MSAREQAEMAAYFRGDPPPSSTEEMADYYIERDIFGVLFAIDDETVSGRPPVPNQYFADCITRWSQTFTAFGNVDPWKGKAAIKDVGRVLDFTFAETDRIAKLYPEPKQGKDFPLEQALEMEPRLRELRDSGEREQRLFDLALRLEGLLRHASKHAAGIVISERPLTDDVPLWVDKDGAVVTQYTFTDVEAIGLIKFDFLGLKTLTLVEKPPADAPVGVAAWADPDALRQVMDNLVDNAIKYTPNGGRITVRWGATADTVSFEVEDTGVGIPDTDVNRVFERFYRVDRARGRGEGSTGLGLSIVKHLVQAMRGQVRVNSKLDKGTTFRVTLPRAGSA